MTSPHIAKRDAKIVKLWVSGDMGGKQIAVKMGMSHEAVRQVLHRKLDITKSNKTIKRKRRAIC